jgi:hypothetical protein
MSAGAFFFLFFLHGTSIGNGQQGISYNVGALRSGGYRYSSARKLTTAKLKN